MQCIVATNDPVLLSFVKSLLADAGIEAVVLDESMSALEGSIGVLPRRLVVAPGDAMRARRVLAEAGLEASLTREGDEDSAHAR